MAAGEVFTRAKCAATGAIASLPAEALKLGHIPGWEAVDGPLPEIPKPNAFPVKADEPDPEPDPEPETEPAAVPQKTQSAGTSSAKKKE
jgi:hypothetical protein